MSNRYVYYNGKEATTVSIREEAYVAAKLENGKYYLRLVNGDLINPQTIGTTGLSSGNRFYQKVKKEYWELYVAFLQGTGSRRTTFLAIQGGLSSNKER